MSAELRRITVLEASPSPDFWVLRTTDTLETVVASGYFTQFSGKPHPGDLIFTTYYSGTTILEVTGSSSSGPLVSVRRIDVEGLSDTVQGLLGQSVPDAPLPVFSGSLTIPTVGATTAAGTSVAATIDGGEAVTIDLVDRYNDDQVWDSDISAGTISLTGLTPATTYGFAERAYPTSEGLYSARAVYSNLVEITTDSVASSISAFSFTAAEDTLNVVIHEFTVSGGTTPAAYDEWSYNFTGDPIDSTSTWAALPTVDTDTVTVPSYGSTTVYARARKSTDTTDMTAVVTATATATRTVGAVPNLTFAATTIGISEEGQPVLDVTINRGDETTTEVTVDITTNEGTGDYPALYEENLKANATTLTFATGVTSQTFPVQILFNNLGHTNGVPRYRTFTLTLSNASGGGATINGTTSQTATVTVYGLHKVVGSLRKGGYHANGQIDLNAPPPDLTIVSQMTTLPTTGTVNFNKYDMSSGVYDYCVRVPDNANTLKIWDCVFTGSQKSGAYLDSRYDDVEFVNCLFLDWHEGPNVHHQRDNCAVTCNNSGSVGAYKLEAKILGCKAVGAGSMSIFWYASGGHRVCWNYFKNTINANLVDFPNKFDDYADGRITMFWDCLLGDSTPGHEIRGNVGWTPRTPYAENEYGQAQDPINIGVRAGYGEANRTFIEMNKVFGAGGTFGVNWTGQDGIWSSAFGVQIDSFATYATAYTGFITNQHNELTRCGNGGFNAGGGHIRNLLSRFNDVYCPPSLDGTSSTENTVGVGGAQSDEYPTYECRCEYNRVMSYQSNGRSSTGRTDYYRWLDNTVDPPVPLPAPTGWSNITNAEEFVTNGANLFDGRKMILSNAAWGAGIHCHYAHYDCPTGNGVIYWDGTADTLQFAAYGESFGTAVSVAAALGVTGEGDWAFHADLPSGSSRGIHVVLDPTTLKAISADKYWPVQVNRHSYKDFHIAPYDNNISETTAGRYCGEWKNTEEISPTGTIDPSIPTNFTATASATSATEIDLQWDDMSVDSYTLYRSLSASSGFTVVASNITGTTTITHTDTGLTTGVPYYYYVVSVDGSFVSAPSQVESATPTEIDTSAIIPGGEFSIDVANTAAFESAYDFTGSGRGAWTVEGVSGAASANVVISGGVMTIQNLTASSCVVIYTESGASPDIFTSGHSYLIECGSSYPQGMTIDIDSVSLAWGTNWKSGDIKTNFGVDAASSPVSLYTNDSTTFTNYDQVSVTFWVGPGETRAINYFRILDVT